MKEKEIQDNMNKSIEATQRNFNTIRTGRANASLLDRVSVEYYGAETPIKSLATISTVDSQTISIQPFDISCLQAIEKSISMSDLGITPNNDGKVIRINVPPLTEERRKEFCKLASKFLEELQKEKGDLVRKLDVISQRNNSIDYQFEEKDFRLSMLEDQMASEKLSEGITGFSKAIEELEELLLKRYTEIKNHKLISAN